MRFFEARRDLYASKAASDITSEIYNVMDAESISLFISGSPSTTTIQGSNADGRSSGITNSTADWSDLSVILSPSPDMIDIEPGFRWIRAQRSETTSVVLNVRNYC